MFWLQDIYKQRWQFLVFLGWGVTGDLFHFSLTRDHLPAPRKQPGQRHPTRGNDGDVHTFLLQKPARSRCILRDAWFEWKLMSSSQMHEALKNSGAGSAAEGGNINRGERAFLLASSLRGHRRCPWEGVGGGGWGRPAPLALPHSPPQLVLWRGRAS